MRHPSDPLTFFLSDSVMKDAVGFATYHECAVHTPQRVQGLHWELRSTGGIGMTITVVCNECGMSSDVTRVEEW